jgi:DNA-binding NarL/FixJ family response regulator
MAAQHHIIVADDDPLFRFVLQQAFAIYLPAALVTGAVSAEDAIAAFELHGADLIVTDYHMAPGPTGVELVQLLRARDASIPVVVVSSDWQVEREALAAGAVSFVLKGGALEPMMQALTALLRSPACR